jgi:hypothetical protein
MNLFRSEEHLARWAARWVEGRAPGATLPVGTLSRLAHVWWGDRLDPAWRPRSRDQNQALLEGLGLTSDFWRLP